MTIERESNGQLYLWHGHIRLCRAKKHRSYILSLEDDLYDQRIRRIAEIEALGFRAYGQRFYFSHTIPQILTEFGAKSAEELEPRIAVRIAGRVATKRLMGKAGFAHLQQDGAQMQIYVRKDAVS